MPDNALIPELVSPSEYACDLAVGKVLDGPGPSGQTDVELGSRREESKVKHNMRGNS